MDVIADMLTRMRNGQRKGRGEVTCVASRLRGEVLKVLKDEGYIRDFKRVDKGDGKTDFQISLKYHQGEPVIREIHRVSKPGCRLYAGAKNIKRIYGGLGIAILSTPRGVMSDARARGANVGGEILCRVF